ncbi:MAG: cation-transporting P-type ATPase, partial [Thermoleophilaceae bacterium]
MTLHAADAAEVARELGTDSERGLRGEEAEARLSRYG